MCICEYVCAIIQGVEVRGQPVGVDSIRHHLNRTQIISLGSRCLHPLSHLNSWNSSSIDRIDDTPNSIVPGFTFSGLAANSGVAQCGW